MPQLGETYVGPGGKKYQIYTDERGGTHIVDEDGNVVAAVPPETIGVERIFKSPVDVETPTAPEGEIPREVGLDLAKRIMSTAIGGFGGGIPGAALGALFPFSPGSPEAGSNIAGGIINLLLSGTAPARAFRAAHPFISTAAEAIPATAAFQEMHEAQTGEPMTTGQESQLWGLGLGLPMGTQSITSIFARRARQAPRIVTQQALDMMEELGMDPARAEGYLGQLIDRSGIALPGLRGMQQVETKASPLGKERAAMGAATTYPKMIAARDVETFRKAFHNEIAERRKELERLKQSAQEDVSLSQKAQRQAAYEEAKLRWDIDYDRMKDEFSRLKAERNRQDSILKNALRNKKAIATDERALDQVLDVIESRTGWDLGKMDATEREVLKTAAKNNPSGLVASIYGKNITTTGTGKYTPDQIRDFTRAIKNLSDEETVHAIGEGLLRTVASRFAARDKTGVLTNFNNAIQNLGPEAVNELFGTKKAYERLLDMGEALERAAHQTNVNKIYIPTAVSMGVSGYFLLRNEPVAAALIGALGGSGYLWLRWKDIIDHFVKASRDEGFTGWVAKRFVDRALHPERGRLGQALGRKASSVTSPAGPYRTIPLPPEVR